MTTVADTLNERQREVLSALAKLPDGKSRLDHLTTVVGRSVQALGHDARHLEANGYVTRLRDASQATYQVTNAGRELATSWEPPSTGRLTWERSTWSGYRGKAGGIELFALHWKTRRESKNYTLKCELPGYMQLSDEHDDAEVLQRQAEKYLATWLAKVNGGPL